MATKGFADNLNLLFVLFFGIIGLVAPVASIIVAHLGGENEIASINSTALMLLSVLIIVFLIIKAFNLFFSNHKKLFLLDLVFLVVVILSFISNLLVFLTL